MKETNDCLCDAIVTNSLIGFAERPMTPDEEDDLAMEMALYDLEE
jgi:hypothetical protein